MTRRTLILIHRGDEYAADFGQIAMKVQARDPDITVHHLSSRQQGQLPESAWQQPVLTVALTSKFRLSVRRGAILKNHAIGKLEQQALFRKNGIPTPPALPFRFGMKLDPILFGDLVILKPADLTLTSGDNCVFPFRRRQLEQIAFGDLPPDHLVNRHPRSFMVQRLIDTGPFPRHLRVQTFFGRTICCFDSRLAKEEPPFDADMQTLRSTIVTTGDGDRIRELVIDEEAIQLAEKAHLGLAGIPSLGFDIIRDHNTRKLYVLECNAGGNTWHFSSKDGRSVREHLGRRIGTPGDFEKLGRTAMIGQFGAFDIAAEALVSKVHECAS